MNGDGKKKCDHPVSQKYFIMKGRFLACGFLLLAFVPLVSKGQKTILGDIKEQKYSQVYDEDTRKENIYRRPPTYLIIASKIVRPSTIYQVITVLDIVLSHF